MSRSRKKTPISGFTTARSEKQDKRIWHGRARSRERQHLLVYVRGHELDDYLTTHFREVSDVWGMGKDGKSRWTYEDALRLQKKYDLSPERYARWDSIRNWKKRHFWK